MASKLAEDVSGGYSPCGAFCGSALSAGGLPRGPPHSRCTDGQTPLGVVIRTDGHVGCSCLAAPSPVKWGTADAFLSAGYPLVTHGAAAV